MIRCASMSSKWQTWGTQVVAVLDWLMANELEHENESTAEIGACCNYSVKDEVSLLHISNMKEPWLKTMVTPQDGRPLNTPVKFQNPLV